VSNSTAHPAPGDTPAIECWAQGAALIVGLAGLGREGSSRQRYTEQAFDLVVGLEIRRRASSRRRGQRRSRSAYDVPEDENALRERLERALSERLAEARAKRHVLAA
jgi:hypothetical protein